MAHHKSAKKRIRQSEKRRIENRFKVVGMRLAVKDLRNETDKNEAAGKLPKVVSIIDRVLKSNIIHKRNAANLKSSLSKHVNSLS